jgi:hypothetical protein
MHRPIVSTPCTRDIEPSHDDTRAWHRNWPRRVPSRHAAKPISFLEDPPEEAEAAASPAAP